MYQVMEKTNSGWIPLKDTPTFSTEDAAWKWIGKQRGWDNITLDVWAGVSSK